MIPCRLQPGDEIRIISPSTSMAVVKGKQIDIAVKTLESLGFNVTFGQYVDEHDEFFSTSIEHRVSDIHEAFRDSNVKGILTAIGGYNSNQLLKYLDYTLIKSNPKVFCGFSDITALHLAIYQKTGLTTYYGPHFSTFGMKKQSDYTIQSFLEAVTNDAPIEIEPSDVWSDDKWYLDQEDRNYFPNNYTILQDGEAEGKLIGGNLCTLNLLQGTEFLPSLEGCILFIEDDEETHPLSFDRDLQSLLHLSDMNQIRGLLIGRFQNQTNMTDSALRKIIESKEELKGIPIIANVNFGHTDPIATIPIGAQATISAKNGKLELLVEQ
ncbi:putative carboxypeptidase YocD [Heyndrickxia sporothermodurans]|nr:putative carboxypeptidase YocD [Heyndrickxia sporothermodurans]